MDPSSGMNVPKSSLKRVCELCGKNPAFKSAFNPVDKRTINICEDCHREATTTPTIRSKRNKPCQCGSGKKFKLCCGKKSKVKTNPNVSKRLNGKTLGD